MVDDPVELGHEPVVGAAAWHQLRESLDRDQRILDLVGDSRRQHLEVREPLGPLPLHLKCLEWREIAEDRDGAQHGAALVVQRRRRADDRPGRGAVPQLHLGLSSGSSLGDGLAQHAAHALWQHTQRLEPHSLGRQPRQLLRGGIEQRDLAGGVDGHHAAFDGGNDVVEVLVGQQHLRIELRVLHRDAGLVGERHQQIEVLRIEGIAGELGPHHDGADDMLFGDERPHERPVQARQRRV